MPVLVNWAGSLTLEGEAVANYLNLIGQPLPKPPDKSLLKPAVLYLRGLTDAERCALWARYQAALLLAVSEV
jgi:hypothetical protein